MENIRVFVSENVEFLEMKYLNRRVFVMTICQSINDFEQTTLLTAINLTKYKGRRVHFRNSRVKGLN